MTYAAKSRETFMDSSLRQALHRRSKELLGLVLFAAGSAAAIACGSYSAEDSGLLNSTGAPAQNLFGSWGAEITSVFIVTLGWASWCLPAFFLYLGAAFLESFWQ